MLQLTAFSFQRFWAFYQTLRFSQPNSKLQYFMSQLGNYSDL